MKHILYNIKTIYFSSVVNPLYERNMNGYNIFKQISYLKYCHLCDGT